jgi:polar amino acid transport system substrate-binding protein
MIIMALFGLVGGLPGTATAARSVQKVLRLAIGEWPPYTGANLPSYGCDAQVVTEAFALVGIQVQFSFLPWARSMLLSKSGMVDGTLEWADTPEYRKDHFFSSQPLSQQQWVFFHRKETQLDWQQLEDLRHFRIGLTIGYVYSDVFNTVRAKSPQLFSDAASDLLNFKKLLNRRIDLFAMEREVGKHLLKSNFSPEEQAAFVIHPKPIAIFSPHLLLSRHVAGNEQRMLLFEQGVQQLHSSGRYREIMASCFSEIE